MGSTTEIPYGKQAIKAYLADDPHMTSPFPAIIILHEWVGLNDHIRDVADRLAEKGYLALAPDLYEGRLAADDAEAESLMNTHYSEASAKALAVFDALAARKDVSKVGCIGLSMGGSLALGLAVAQPKLNACVSFYGLPEEFFSKLGSVRSPILGLYADQDQWVPVDQVHQLDRELSDAAVAHEVVIYPGSEHDFFNDRGATYQADAAQDAWRRMVLFLEEHLR